MAALEEFPPENFEFIYCLVKSGERAIGIVYFQVRQLVLDQFFQEHDHGFNQAEKIRNWIFSKIRHDLLICGNVLLTGPYAYKFHEDISSELKANILNNCFAMVKKDFLKRTNRKIKSVLIKDFDKGASSIKHFGNSFTNFEVEPSMTMRIPHEWNEFEDYLAAIKSKYKVRYKRAKKKFGDLVVRKLSCDDLMKFNDIMYALFDDTAQKADFSLFKLHPIYFGGLHKFLGEDMNTFGVFENEKMLAFFTLIKNGNKAEAHFLGYDMASNKKYQLYHNMLFHMIKASIKMDVEYLNLSRTALEIKSSIGAVPSELELLVHYDGKIINSMMGRILNLTVPKKVWEQRNPFKE